MGEVIGKAAWAGARPDSPEERLGWRRYRLCSTSRGNQPKAHQLSGCSWAADVKLWYPLLAESGRLAQWLSIRHIPGRRADGDYQVGQAERARDWTALRQ